MTLHLPEGTIEELAADFAPVKPVELVIDATFEDMYLLGSYKSLNIVPAAESSFAANIDGWTAVSGCAVSWDSVNGHSGPGCLKVTKDGTAGSAIVRSKNYPVTEALLFTNEFFSRPNTTQRNVFPVMEWRNDAGDLVGTPTIAKLTPERNNTWQRPTALGTAPLGATQVSITIEWVNNQPNEIHRLDDFVIRLAADRIYARHAGVGNIIQYCDPATSPGIDRWFPLPALASPCTIYKVVQALNGDVVAFANQSGVLHLMHLARGTSTWVEAQVIQPNVNALYNSMIVMRNGDVVFAEYATSGGGVVNFNIHLSSGNGAVGTWAHAAEFVDFHGHIHGLREDDFIDNRLWCLMGDSDLVANIRYTDNIKAGVGSVAWTVIDSGSQRARAVSIMFTETHVVWPGDTPELANQNVFRYDRSTGEIETIATGLELTSFYSVMDMDGRYLVATAARTDNDGYPPVRIWGGRASEKGVQGLVSLPPIKGAVRLDCYADGVDSAGNIIISYVDQGVNADSAVMMRAHMIDGNPSEVRLPQILDRQRTVQTSYLKVGSWPGVDDGVSSAAGRIYLVHFYAPAKMVAGSISLHIGSTVAGSAQVGLLAPDAKDYWKQLMAVSTLDVVPTPSVDQKFTLDRKVVLARTLPYVVAIKTTAAGLKFRGGTAGIPSANHTRHVTDATDLTAMVVGTDLNDTKLAINSSFTIMISST